MKNYKEVELLAKNAPTGSYAAGCPVGTRVTRKTGYWFPDIEGVKTENGHTYWSDATGEYDVCRHCELFN